MPHYKNVHARKGKESQIGKNQTKKATQKNARKKHDKFSTKPSQTKQIMTHFTKIDRIAEIG